MTNYKYRAIGVQNEIGMIVHFLSENGYGVLRLSFGADPFMEEARFNEVAYMELLKQDWFLKIKVDVFLNTK